MTGRILGLFAVGWTGLAHAVEPPAKRTAVPATHVLFMGAELAAERGRVYYPVVDVSGASLVIKPGGSSVRLPLASAANLRITEQLKLSEASVALDDYKAERAYSAGADPSAQLAKTAALAAGESAVADLAAAAERSATLAVGEAGVLVANATRPEQRAEAQAMLNRAQATQAGAQASLDRALAAQTSQIYDVASQSTRLNGSENFDAIRITFTVTAETDLAQPYYGIIARIHDPDARPGQTRPWVYLQPLGAMVAGETRKVLVHQSGFPPGYQLAACEVHVYDGEQELATNLSRRRVPLSDQEAREYRVFEYIGANKGRTLPAALVTRSLATGVWAAVPKAQLAETFHVRVGKDGTVAAAFRDAAGRKPVADADVTAALKTLRFNPALDAGKPVESLAPVVLGSLAVQ
jgi:hypothetical protein